MNFMVTEVQPTEPGSEFVVTWIFRGRLWAEDFLITSEGVLKRYVPEEDRWVEDCTFPLSSSNISIQKSIRYLIAME